MRVKNEDLTFGYGLKRVDLSDLVRKCLAMEDSVIVVIRQP
jgi:hypothetical protein